ncbi:hypothetical protein [Streptomyces sp. NPDC021356]|uniref:hypothetical protein n=1 Tax=Streptomyces sp. NPDC021356 TaxID=3154900 RepID=UPI0033F1D9F5
MSKHRKITQNRRRMYSIAAGTLLAAVGTGGIATAATPTHQAAANAVHQAAAATPTHQAASPTAAQAHRAAHANPEHYANAARPISELSAAERANAVG